MTKRLVSAAASVAAIGAAALALAPGAMAAPNLGGCQITGTATFNNPLMAGPSASPFTYTFSGTLSNCKSGSTGGLNSTPTGGTIFTPDPATGSGSCVSSSTSGAAVVQWNDGDTTVETYTTTGALAAVAQQGKVVASYTSTTQTNPDGTPVVYTTNEPSTPVGDSGLGLLAFQPPSPTSCQTGVNTAAINGVVGQGNNS